MVIETPDAPHLPQIAPMMADLGQHLCAGHCRSYHRAWGYMRLYGVLPAVGRDHDTLLAAYRAELRAGARDVLISGSADAGILSYVLAAMQAEGVTGRVAVLDLCTTPLAVCAWYGEQHGIPIETWRGPVQDYQGRDFDLIVAHNFAQSIPKDGRPAMARTWHDALRPGGRLVIQTQIKPGDAEYGKRFDAEQLDLLVEDVLKAQDASPHRELITPEALIALVRAYGAERNAYRFRSVEDFTAMIESGGLRVTDARDIQASQTGSAASPLRRRMIFTATRLA